MECSISYDFATEGFRYWYLPLIGGVFGLVCAAAYRVARFIFGRSVFGLQLRIGALVGASIAIISSCYVTFQAYSEYRGLRNDIIQGKAQFIEGTITSFVPAPKLRRQIESFAIGEKEFSYSPSEVAPGFRKTQASGSPIQEGLYVQVTYVREAIVKLETCR
jgi:hypothetical protein